VTVIACSIAGSDPSGGAGIQADLKTFSALGAYGTAVIAGLTAQATTGVTAVMEVPAPFVASQIDSLFADVRVDAVKIGMLGTAPVVSAVAAGVERWRPPVVVLDPVMVAKSGDRLLDEDAVDRLVAELLPLVHLVTPNLAEAAVLLDADLAGDTGAMAEQARRLTDLGPPWALVKGGHLDGVESIDVLAGPGGAVETLVSPRVGTTNDHGTGCTLSSAIAALRPRQPSWPATVRAAKHYLTGALAAGRHLHIGHGHGPVHHFYAWWPSDGPEGGRP
jgi:hydroxymethylpyrimidine/phosphomethylpyrimidine kinase